jgi:amino acid transporter
MDNDHDSDNIFEHDFEKQPINKLQDLFIGRPIHIKDAAHQAIGKLIGLAVFSSDALSSVAYGPQELMIILAAAGMSTVLSFTFPIACAIVILLTILTISYEQTIHAYPGGGGAYIVARDNLGELPAQTAGAALLMDYVLTVAVSISSGVAQLVSAYPGFFAYRVYIGVGLILLVMLINLRGVKEAGMTFAIPTYFFIISMYVMLFLGLFRFLTGNLGVITEPPEMAVESIKALSLFLILRAFASGTASVTGVEAISNGIMAFKEPRSKNAGKTLIMMAVILGSMLISTAFLAVKIAAVPSQTETIISQLARTIFDGRGVLYLSVIAAATVILVMAANTAFADFPRLGAIQAADGFLPRQLTHRSGRFVFSRGIAALAVLASLLVIAFQASVTKLIPLYAIGVFLSFTLSQTGMAVRWWKIGHLKPGVIITEPGSTLKFEKGWQTKLVINGFGAICTFVVMFVFAITKFAEGAWVVVILIPVLISIFFAIHRHYKFLANKLSLDNRFPNPRISRNRVIIPIGGVHQGTLAALQYAKTLSDDVTALHVSVDEKETKKLTDKWEMWGDNCRLVIIKSAYRTFHQPLLEYVQEISAICEPSEMITIVIPQFITNRIWERLLHSRTAELIRSVLIGQKNVVIIEVPYQIH